MWKCVALFFPSLSSKFNFSFRGREIKLTRHRVSVPWSAENNAFLPLPFRCGRSNRAIIEGSRNRIREYEGRRKLEKGRSVSHRICFRDFWAPTFDFANNHPLSARISRLLAREEEFKMSCVFLIRTAVNERCLL